MTIGLQVLVQQGAPRPTCLLFHQKQSLHLEVLLVGLVSRRHEKRHLAEGSVLQGHDHHRYDQGELCFEISCISQRSGVM